MSAPGGSKKVICGGIGRVDSAGHCGQPVAMRLLLPVAAAALAALNPSGAAAETGRIADIEAPETMRGQAKCATEIAPARPRRNARG
jgi:hypothetical protein